MQPLDTYFKVFLEAAAIEGLPVGEARRTTGRTAFPRSPENPSTSEGRGGAGHEDAQGSQ